MRDVLSIEQRTAAIQGRGRQVELQSIRGLAALLVVVHHCTFYFDYDLRLKHVAEVLLNAHAAVVLFFVLSGYVLCQSLVQRPIDAASTVVFYVRRVFRVYPALWIAVALAFGYVLLFHDRPLPASVTHWWWPANYRAFPAYRREYLYALASVSTTLPVPIWTLTIELAASAMMPAVALIATRRPAALVPLAALASAAVVLAGPLPTTLLYLPAFVIGACVLVALPWLEGRMADDRAWLSLAAAGAALLLFGRNLFVADFRFHYAAPVPLVLEAVGGAMVIVSVSGRAALFPFLRRRALVWLGDISYSLYLLHLPVLALVAGVCAETLHLSAFETSRVAATAILLALVLAISIPLAALSYRFVEEPFIAAGKRAASLGRRLPRRASAGAPLPR